MQLSRRVALDGVQLDSVDSRILIQSVEPAAGKDQISAVSRAGGSGSRVTGTHRDSMDVVVKFSINEKSYNPGARSEVLDKVKAWARPGGVLTVNYKSGQRIRVIAAQLPGEGDIKNRGNTYAITFRAYDIPYWEDSSETTLVSATSVSSNTTAVTIGGSAETPLSVTFENTASATADTFSIQAGGKTIAFESLGLAAGERLIIDETSAGIFRARIRNTNAVYRSVLGKRTTASSDNLRISPGGTNIITSAAQAGTLSVKYRRRYA